MSFGLALDIGTTTLEAYIVDIDTMTIVNHIAQKNKQCDYGIDVLSRLDYCKSNGLSKLKNTIESQISSFIAYPIDKAVISGNTVMMHILFGIDTSTMNTAPFSVSEHFNKYFNNYLNCKSIYIPNCPSAFIGADITAGLVATKIDQYENALFIDIGTNCEIVLKQKDKYIGCSVAAGPALEGGQTSCGMIATSGAINNINTISGRINYSTIDNETPIGICGSGYIDALVCMHDLKIIDDNGYIKTDYYIDKDVKITSEDVRAILLAKSSICAGIKSLLELTNMDHAKLETVFLTGGICKGINLINASRLGLIPPYLMSKIRIIDNACLNGSLEILKSGVYNIPHITTVQLAHLDIYKNHFINGCTL